MGEARKTNVSSGQYRGEMPDNIIGAKVITKVGVEKEWLEANPPTDIPTRIPDEKQFVQWQLVGILVQPSALVDREHWPTHQVDLGVVKQMTLAEFKELALPKADGVETETDGLARLP